jgi:RND family efflux transporter MFP subunit
MVEDKRQLLNSLSIDRGPAAAPRSRGLWPWLIAGVAVLALGWFVASDYWMKDAPAPKASPTPVAEPAPAPSAAPARRPAALVASGYVVARRKATVAAEVTGKVVEVNVEEGRLVNQGDVLARLDSVLAESDLKLARSRQATAEAAIASVAADLRDAELIWNRTQNLSRRDFASNADLTKAEARVGVLRAELQKAKASLETARLDAQRAAEVVEKHTIRAPFSGIVTEKSAQPGEMISPLSAGGGFTRTGICTIVDMDSIEVEVDVNEAYIGRVEAGQRVDAVLDAYPDVTFPASVIAIVPTANRDKATVKVRIGFERKDPRILPDMGVKVTFAEEAKGG